LKKKIIKNGKRGKGKEKIEEKYLKIEGKIPKTKIEK